MDSELTNILVVTGPTASGKSDLALQLATNLGGELVVLDSVQVYRGADVGSAKATAAEQARVRHHLIDILDPSEQFDAGRFIDHARAAINDIVSRGAVPIVVGGTTLYLTTLLHGLADEPKKSPELRASLEALEPDELWQRLCVRDPGASTILHRNDRLRIIRAIERVELGGSALADLQQAHGHRGLFYRALLIAPVWERRELQARIERRTDAMLEAGLVGEAQALAANGASRGLITAVGYRQVLTGVQGAALRHEIITATRRYAKRQMTYLRNEPIKREWTCLPQPEDPHAIRLSQQFGSVKTDAEVLALRLSTSDVTTRAAAWLGGPRAAAPRPELWFVDGAWLNR